MTPAPRFHCPIPLDRGARMDAPAAFLPACIVSRIAADVISKKSKVSTDCAALRRIGTGDSAVWTALCARYEARRQESMRPRMSDPSPRKLAGIALIVGLIVLWAAFVASLAQVVGKWPVLVQAPYYLFMGVAWVIPLKPLVRWIETGSFRARR